MKLFLAQTDYNHSSQFTVSMKHPFQNVPNSLFYSVNHFIPENCYFASGIQLIKGMVVEGNTLST